MAGRIFLGSIRTFYPRPNYSLNLWGQLRSCSYSTTNKANTQGRTVFNSQVSPENNYLKTKEIKQAPPSIQDRLATASPEEIASDRDLLNELARQYETTKTDEDFIEGTKFCMEMMKSRLSGQ